MSEHLNESGQKLYNGLSKMIPGFNPVLDQMMLTQYVMELQFKEQLLREIKESETEQKTGLLKDLLKQAEKQIVEYAEALALTPATRREIEILLKRKKN